jgi:hypothetical protein
MEMYLGEVPVYTIMLMGRWSSNAFLLLHMQTGRTILAQRLKEDDQLLLLPSHPRYLPEKDYGRQPPKYHPSQESFQQ